MSWLTDYVRPKFRTLLGKPEVPDNLWTQCEGCEKLLYSSDLEKNLRVCPHCGHHMQISATARLGFLFDEGKYQRLDLPKVPADPLGFRDEKRYSDRLRDARGKTHLDDALIVASGTIGGVEAVAAAMEFRFMGGSMGAAVGEGLVTAARHAVQIGAPLIMFTASGGARMQEGMVSLMQMPRSTIAVQMVREAGLPYIVVLTNPTTGGVTASFAMLGDIHIAEPGATIGFAGARVIEQTVRETLPDGFQRAEYLLDHGIVDMVVPRGEMAATISRVLGLLCRKPKADADMPQAELALAIETTAAT
jgi:acetyl-CoA carboxylase carboxyl transferase subunit beta